MEKEEKVIVADIYNLIALCHIIDDFEEFIKSINELDKSKDKRAIIHDIDKISRGEFVFRFGIKKLNTFYQDNKSVIDKINKYSNLSHFVIFYYDFGEKNAMDFFHKYILSHKEDIDKIILLLEKIKKLGIKQIQFSEEIDFTDKVYSVNRIFNYNNNVLYLDNMAAVPNYQYNIVKYRTTDSNYEINLRIGYKEFAEHMREIKVNSLLFDAERLPDEITIDSIFNKIIKLKKEKQAACDIVEEDVELSVALKDLFAQFATTSNVIERLKNVSSKEQMLNLLKEIKSGLDKINELKSAYEADVLQEDLSITNEVLEGERRLYLENRTFSYFDLD